MRENGKGWQKGAVGSGLESGRTGRQASDDTGALDKETTVSTIPNFEKSLYK